MIFIKQVCSLQPMIIESPRNKMLATRLDCLIGPELSKPYRAGLALTESCSCSVRPSQAGPLLGKVWLVPKPGRDMEKSFDGAVVILGSTMDTAICQQVRRIKLSIEN